ncbi:DUF456 domain-containing protein [Streptomyces tsukubensis]|uniref:DUF456 domain-containing protein n=1 Tax=Streptomyces tsukubensis TaxID=83656 RepID=A0A1V4AA00_9ACTN|nr:DUF456 domain-containing protein [Streptomyces tsukubensis]OON80642.1 hypothetical protein B1H18_12290 [Streptomyces tsukubensis]QFR96303.1 DUF456 family protein [Streptomyces tsukubensis]
MGVPELLLVGLVLLLGLCGVLVPGVPGPWLVWAAVLWWALQAPSPVVWGVLVGSTALLLLSRLIRWQLPPRRVRGSGVTRRMVVWAGLGSVLGFVVVPVVGAVPGFIGGMYASERLRLGGRGEAVASTRTVMRAMGTSVLVEFFACLLIAGVWLAAVVRGW